MAKWSRTKVGEVVKGKVDTDQEGNVISRKPDYIKIYQDVTLRKGQFLNLETVADQKKSAEEANKAGKLVGENFEKVMGRLNKIPDFIRFEIVLVNKEAE